jgi:hypothetical protein
VTVVPTKLPPRPLGTARGLEEVAAPMGHRTPDDGDGATPDPEMPPTQRGQAYKLGPGSGACATTTRHGVRRRKSPFPTKSAALQHYREHIEPVLLGEPAPLPELTLAEFVELYLERHAVGVRPRTIATLRERLGTRCARSATCRCASWSDDRRARGVAGAAARARRATGSRRRCARRSTPRCAGDMSRNPAKDAGRNPKPSPRAVRAFTRAEVDAIALELSRSTRRCRRSPRRRPAARRSGRRSSAATSTAAPASCTSGARCRAARSSSSPRRSAAAGRCRCPARARRARRAAAAAGHAAAVAGARGRPAEHRQLPPAAVGARGRRLRRRDGRRGSTTCARRSPPTRSRPASARSSSRR